MVCAKTIFAWNRNAKRKTEYPNVPTKVASRARRYTPPCFACWGRLPNPTKRPRSGAAARPCGRFHAGASPRQVARAKNRVKGQDERVVPALDAAPRPRRFAAKEGKPHQAFPPAKATSREKKRNTLSVLFLLPFRLFPRIAQEPVDVHFRRKQFLHFLACGGVPDIGFFLFGKQRVILGLER